MSVASTGERSLEAGTLRKVIIRIVPFLMMLYFVNYLDRTNLGIAKTDISAHLQLSSTMFGAYRARMIALFMMASPIATAIGTPISAWLIAAGDGFLGLAGWQFMMISVGIPAIVLGMICWFYLTDRPSDARWLASDERQWLVDVLAEEERHICAHFDFPLRRALVSPRIWALSLAYFGIAYGLYALAFFLPSIITGFNKTFGIRLDIIQIGLITAIPYAFAAVAMYVWSRHADRTREHVWHVAIPMLVGGLAIPVALYLHSPVLVMIPVTVAAIGVFSAFPSFWSLPSRFLTGAAAAGGIALINSIGNLGGFAAPYATGALDQLTGSDKAGMWAVGVVMVMSAALVVVLRARPDPDRRARGTLGPNPPVNR